MTRYMRRTATRAALAAAAVLALAGPAAAAAAGPAALFARSSWSGYWTRFIDYWGALFKQTNGITLIVIGVGIVSLYIITRGKWRK